MNFLQVIYFYQAGCPACEEMRPLFDKAVAHYAQCDVVARYVDVHHEGLTADTMQVQETPTVIGTRNHSPVTRMIGAQNADQRLGQLFTELLSGGSCTVQPWRGDV